jgi:hypothetical protein
MLPRPGSRSLLLALAAAWAGLTLSAAQAKDFERGDLRACGATRCRPVIDRRALTILAHFYYGAQPLTVAPSPRMRTPYFTLRFRNGYVTGIVAGKRLDRFLSYGVVTDRFHRGTWYRVPSAAARSLRVLVASLQPRRLDAAAVRKSR